MLTLLLADDSVTTQRVIALTFAEESFRVVTASDGQQALDAMAGPPPDIVLASTVLPRISGYDLAPQAPLALSSVADDFAALLAFETGDAVEPPPVPASAAASAPIVVQAGAPEITDAILDQIAQRVADRLNSSNFGADLRTAMTAAIRDTVRTVVADTSERLVRDEIGRVKARAERDTR